MTPTKMYHVERDMQRDMYLSMCPVLRVVW